MNDYTYMDKKNYENNDIAKVTYPKFLEEISKMREINLVVKLLKKLIVEQAIVYKRTNMVESEKFIERIQRALNSYLNGMLTNEGVI